MADSVAGTVAYRHAADLVGVVLAAGKGRRLRPLTDLRPKPLCPVGNVALVDLALDRVAAASDAIAVNLHHGRAAMERHLADRGGAVHRSVEEPEALGTAGALGRLRSWIDGRPALVVNADAWHDADLARLVSGWDGERVRLLVTPDPATAGFGPRMGVVASLSPWSEIERLAATPSGLYELVWRPAQADGRLDLVEHQGRFVDCGTPADYLRANLGAVAQAGASIVADDAEIADDVDVRVDRSVIGTGACVSGRVHRSVLWAGAEVVAGEELSDAIRAPGLTVEVR